MKVLFATTLLGLFATGVKAACGEKHLGDPGAEFYLDCRHHACNVLELDAQDNIRNQYGVKPVGDGSCKIKIRVYGDGGLRDIANHENTATIIPTGDVMCDTFDVKSVSTKTRYSGGITCSSDSRVFSTVEGNFQAWCGTELPDARVEGGTISGLCLDNYVSCYGWTCASEYGREDPYEDNPICWGSGLE